MIARIRFAYEPVTDESVIGALASACHGQRLRAIATALNGAGVALVRPGLLQIAPENVLDRVAAIMRAAPEKLNELAFIESEAFRKVILGDLILPRLLFELNRRRIGPRTLSKLPHHRSAWLNRLLPYCPESLELLVDACPACGPLGWRYTRGIANCEHCGLPIEASDEADLPVQNAGYYRQFAALVARHPRMDESDIKLPTCLHGFSRTTLANVAIRSGMICSPVKNKRSIDRLINETPAMIAEIVSTGMRMLAEWPSSVLEFVQHRESIISNDIPQYQALRADIRWIAEGGGGSCRPSLSVA